MLETYYNELTRYFTYRTGDKHTAEDAVMDAYVKAIQYLRANRPIHQPRAFLYKSVRNVLLSQAQRRAVEERVLNTISIISAGSVSSTEDQCAAREEIARLLTLLDGMTDKRRDAFILVRIHGFSYREAADYMGLSLQAVEKLVARALMQCMGYPTVDSVM